MMLKLILRKTIASVGFVKSFNHQMSEYTKLAPK